MTSNDSRKGAVRRRMAETGEKYTDASRALDTEPDPARGIEVARILSLAPATTVCKHEPFAVDVFTEDGTYVKADHPGLTWVAIICQGASGGTASDGTPGEIPKIAEFTARAEKLPEATAVTIGKPGRGAPKFPAHGGPGGRTVVTAAGGGVDGGPGTRTVVGAYRLATNESGEIDRQPDGAPGWMIIRSYSCGCPPPA